MRALVTGSAGFIGRHFVRELRHRGWEVSGIDKVEQNFPNNLDWDSQPGSSGTFKYTTGDLIEAMTFTARHGVDVFDLVVHAAALAPNRAAIDSVPTSHIYNRMLDAAVFDWAIKTGQKHMLYFSSCAVLDAEPDDYGMLKLSGERMAELARRVGTKVTVVRPFSGYGSDQSAEFPFGAFISRAMQRQDPFTVWGDGRQVRDWIHIDDIVDASLAVVESGTKDPISLCTGIGTSVLDVAKMIANLTGYSPKFDLLEGKPSGPSRRVGDPRDISKFYTTRISLEEGILRALKDRMH